MTHFFLIPSEMMLLFDWEIFKTFDYLKKIEKTVGGMKYRNEYVDYETAKNFMLRASSGILQQRNDTKYEIASFCVWNTCVFLL